MENTKELQKFLERYSLDNLPKTILKDGISNTNYSLGDKYALKVPYDRRFIELKPYQIQLQNLAARNFISPEVCFFDIENGFLVTELLKNYKPIKDSEINIAQIKKIVELLHAYSSLDISEIDVPKLNYQKMLDNFRLQVFPKDRIYIHKLESSHLLLTSDTLSHFDMVSNNILTDGNCDVQLIDFEFACLTPKYFDLVSLISENQFPESKNRTIVNQYFLNDPTGLEEFLKIENQLKAIFDLLWYHWAKARAATSNKKNRNVYLQIAADKKTTLFRYLHKLND